MLELYFLTSSRWKLMRLHMLIIFLPSILMASVFSYFHYRYPIPSEKENKMNFILQSYSLSYFFIILARLQYEAEFLGKCFTIFRIYHKLWGIFFSLLPHDISYSNLILIQLFFILLLCCALHWFLHRGHLTQWI